MTREAMLYQRLEKDEVRCYLCGHRCLIRDGRQGICLVRENQGGTLYTLVYGRTISAHVDPIEKKPLFHFYPGTTAFSVATVGCNFHCRFCQNSDISQMVRDEHYIMGEEMSPGRIVGLTREQRSRSIAYTYTEPTIFFEYAYDTAKLAHEVGIKNIFVTNGYMTPEALALVQPYLDAANVDLKSFSDSFYRRTVGARLDLVLESLRLMKKLGIWLEITTLLVPTLNDSDDEVRQAAHFIAHELGVDTPWHISRFSPAYKLTDKPSTPTRTLQRARQIGLEAGLRYVYEGNVPGSEGESTYCYNCGNPIVRRYGYFISEKHIQDSRCTFCGVTIDGVGL